MHAVRVATLVAGVAICGPALGQAQEPVFRGFESLKWEDLGDGAQKGVVLHTNPATKATEMLIQTPKNYHVGRHWHSANETITVIRGTFVVGHDGSNERAELTPGSYAYMPAKMVHDAWTKDDGAMFLVTVDGAWDINWVR